MTDIAVTRLHGHIVNKMLLPGEDKFCSFVGGFGFYVYLCTIHGYLKKPKNDMNKK